MIKANPTELWLAAVGGIILGISCSIYLLTVGRVTGMSGALRSVYSQITLQRKLDPRNIVYLGGLILGGSVLAFCIPTYFEDGYYPEWVMAVSGAIVGVGTTMGCGCTSGHGLCGLARFSKRSLFAVGTFFSIALLVASTIEPSLRSEWKPDQRPNDNPGWVPAYVGIAISSFIVVVGFFKLRDSLLEAVCVLVSALLFSLGLVLSGMVKPTKVHGFLALRDGWDPSLALVMAGGVATNVVLFHFILARNAPVVADAWDLPKKTEITVPLIVGAVIFGIGWALGGICPGPGVVGLSGRYGWSNWLWIAGFICGAQFDMTRGKMMKSNKGSFIAAPADDTKADNGGL